MEESNRAGDRVAPVGLAQGYDTVLGEGRNTALLPTTEIFGGESTVRYRVCEGIQELMDELEVTQSLTVGLTGILSVNQKLEFISRQKLTTHSICIVVYAKHTEGTETVTDVALRPGVQLPESDRELNDFFHVYGDCYMSSRTIGGEYFGVYTFYSETLEETEELRTEMQVRGIFKAFVGQAGLQSTISSFNSTQSVRISFDQQVTGIANPSFPSPDNIIQYALDFPSLELTSPMLTHFKAASYMRVPGIGSRFNVVARNVESLVAGKITAQLSHLQELQNDITSIEDAYNTYNQGFQDQKLLLVKAQADADLETIKATVRSFERDASKPVEIPVLPSLSHGTPSLAFVMMEEGDQFANADISNISGRQPFDDVGKRVRGWLQRRTRISALRMGMLNYYDNLPQQVGLLVTYTRPDGVSWTAAHGPVTGTMSAQLLVPQGQVVTYIRCTLGPRFPNPSWVTHLSIELSNQQRVAHGPESTALVYEIRPRPTFFLVGFRGHKYGTHELYNLQGLCASFIPAVWRT